MCRAVIRRGTRPFPDRTDQTRASDNTDAADRLAIQHGYTQIYPAQTMGAWITADPNAWTGRAVPLEFRYHVAAVVFPTALDEARVTWHAHAASLTLHLPQWSAVLVRLTRA